MAADIEPQDLSSAPSGAISLWFARRFFSLDERISFFGRLAELLDANFSLRAALETYYRGFSEKLKKDDTRIIFLRDVLGGLAEGRDLSEALAPWVGPSERILLEAGEKSGYLAESLRSCGRVAKNAKEIRQAVTGSLIDPAINGTFFIGTAIYYAVALMPSLAKLSDPAHWTGTLYLWYVVSEWLRNYSAATGILLLALGAASWWSLSRLRPGTARRWLDRIPPWSLYRRIQGAIVLTSVSAMLKSGMTLRATLERVRDRSPAYLEGKLEEMLDRLGGESLKQDQIADVFDVNLLAPEEVVEIGIYAKTKTISESLVALADHNTQSTMQWIKARIEGVGFLIDILAAVYTTISLLALMGLSSAIGGGGM